MADTALGQIVAFVEGRIPPAAFAKALAEDADVARVLAQDPRRPPNTFVGSDLFQYVLGEDLRSPAGVLNAHAALAEFLDRNNHRARPTRQYRDFYTLLLAAQPRWLDVDATYLQNVILPAAGGLAGGELKRWLRAELRKRFPCVGKPPRWLQSPRWPIGEHGPLVFLGQLPGDDRRHDAAMVYVFRDPVSGACSTVVQVQ